MDKETQYGGQGAAVAKALEDLIAKPWSAFAYLTLAYRLHRDGRYEEEAAVRKVIDERWGRVERPSAG